MCTYPSRAQASGLTSSLPRVSSQCTLAPAIPEVVPVVVLLAGKLWARTAPGVPCTSAPRCPDST